jgi:hypothetical protein
MGCMFIIYVSTGILRTAPAALAATAAQLHRCLRVVWTKAQLS